MRAEPYPFASGCDRRSAPFVSRSNDHAGESRAADPALPGVDPGRARPDRAHRQPGGPEVHGRRQDDRLAARRRQHVRVPRGYTRRRHNARRRFRLHLASRRAGFLLGEFRHQPRGGGQLESARALPAGRAAGRSTVPGDAAFARILAARHGAAGAPHRGRGVRVRAGLAHHADRFAGGRGHLLQPRGAGNRLRRAALHRYRRRQPAIRGNGTGTDRELQEPGGRDGRAIRRAALPRLSLPAHAERSRGALRTGAPRIERRPRAPSAPDGRRAAEDGRAPALRTSSCIPGTASTGGRRGWFPKRTTADTTSP